MVPASDGGDDFAAKFHFSSITPIPLSARHGDNVVWRSANMPWYDGPTILEHLESIEPERAEVGPFRLPVQWVNRPDASFRGYAGTIASGTVRPGDSVVISGSGRMTKVSRIVTADGDRDTARAGDAVTLTIADAIDISRGDVIASSDSRPEVADVRG